MCSFIDIEFKGTEQLENMTHRQRESVLGNKHIRVDITHSELLKKVQ